MSEPKFIAVARPFGWHFRAITKSGMYGEGWINSAEKSAGKVTEYLLQRHSRVLELELTDVNQRYAKAFASGTEMTRCSSTDGMEMVDDENGDWYLWEER